MGRPKPLRQVIRDNPELASGLIIMPLDASNAGKNYGTGGDFTANSGPYVGARGGSEFWARSAKFVETSYLARITSLNGSTDSKTFSFVASITNNESASSFGTFFLIGRTGPTAIGLKLIMSSDGNLYIEAKKLDGTTVLYASLSAAIPSGTSKILAISIDLSNTSKRFIYVNGTLASVTWTTYLNEVLRLSLPDVTIGVGKTDVGTYDNNPLSGSVAMCYFTTDYIDFSQEVNRNKFVDKLGYPKDLAKQIEAGVIPSPLIYLPFDDPTNLGKNIGTGGNFTVNGTVTQGADFSI